jgi:hypothetical protein
MGVYGSETMADKVPFSKKNPLDAEEGVEGVYRGVRASVRPHSLRKGETRGFPGGVDGCYTINNLLSIHNIWKDKKIPDDRKTH